MRHHVDSSSSETTMEKINREKVYRLISELVERETREQAIEELWKIRQDVTDLGVLLWYSFGAVTSLIQEIVSVYPSLYPCIMTNTESSRVSHALSLLQLCALHDDTKALFFNAHIPQLMLPFLTSTDVNRESEMPRFTVIAMFASLVNMDDRQETIQYILNNNILHIFLRIIQVGTELSKTLATYILSRVLTDSRGIKAACSTPDQTQTIITALNRAVQSLLAAPSSRLLKNVLKCYASLLENPRANEMLRVNSLTLLKDASLVNIIREERRREKDASIEKTYQEILHNLEKPLSYVHGSNRS